MASYQKRKNGDGTTSVLAWVGRAPRRLGCFESHELHRRKEVTPGGGGGTL
jgi:hypothetical protein